MIIDSPPLLSVDSLVKRYAENTAVDGLSFSVREGSCFGLPDTVDRYRHVSHDPHPPGGKKGDARPLQAPGSYWEYNDVRINQLSLALLGR